MEQMLPKRNTGNCSETPETCDILTCKYGRVNTYQVYLNTPRIGAVTRRTRVRGGGGGVVPITLWNRLWYRIIYWKGVAGGGGALEFTGVVSWSQPGEQV